MKVDGIDVDESISDTTIAEMEADIYGLQVISNHLNGSMHKFLSKFISNNLHYSDMQIIKDSDLEEVHELGSGTFGTVYHGKWRGTDVAIKRIKKSCFSGRSSEQERLVGLQNHWS